MLRRRRLLLEPLGKINSGFASMFIKTTAAFSWILILLLDRDLTSSVSLALRPTEQRVSPQQGPPGKLRVVATEGDD